jgi:hypothetical protein
MQQAIKNCPKGIKKPDWEWLVKEHFYSKDFIVSVNLVTYIVTTCVLHILSHMTMVRKIISWNCRIRARETPKTDPTRKFFITVVANHTDKSYGTMYV